MKQAPDPFSPAMQEFLKAGQAMAQTLLESLQSQVPGGSAAAEPAPPVPDPEGVAALQQRFFEKQSALWRSMLEGGREAVVEPEPGDKRFAAPEWRESPVFDYLRQAYLLNAGFVKEYLDLLPVADEKTRKRVHFLARQYLDAVAPTNFAATNPEFIKTAVETQGRSITDGINNLIADLDKGRISMTDESAFEVGRNLATTPGAVVYENELIQLIQYAPTTPTVAKRPLLIVPPCINKYYILDLSPENSFVRHAVDQGNTVFLVSWRNPQADLGHRGWDDYLELGPIAAIEVVRRICRVPQVNALGFCVGGTILSSALAVLRARDEDPVASLTLLTTLLDFSDTGEIGLLIDAGLLAAREATIGQGGLMRGAELASVFSFLRANDLVWNYVANNYLKGRKPDAFDLLYWNSDSTNLPGVFACWYMRHMYHDNSLRIPGKLEMCGVRVDLGRVEAPAYILAAREDHIVPWQTAYQSTRILGGATRFVLGASGHIAGVVNPAKKNRRSHWVGAEGQGAATLDAEAWLAAAEERPGSWWTDWSHWLSQFSGGERSARSKLGNAKYKEIEPAPGRYVKEKA